MRKNPAKNKYYNNVALRTAVIYIIVSALWILFSDRLLLTNPKNAIYISTLKGWIYTLVVGFFLYLSIAREFNRRNKSELRYRRLFETAKDGILLINFDTGMITDVNPFLIDLLGYSKVDFLEKHLWEVGAFKDVADSKENFAILQEKKYIRFEDLPLETQSGKKIQVEFVANAYTVSDEMVIQCNIRDISRAKEIDRIKSDFISVASHQLRTPLTGIKWFSQLLINQKIGKLSKKQIDFIAQIYNSNERMIRLVNDLLDVSHIESGQKFNIEKKPGDIIALINNVIKDQKLNTPNKKIIITLDNKCPKALNFDFDDNKIYQVFSNLISNSVKYSGQQAKIIIGTTCLGSEAQFFVKDFGLGIPNNQQDRVFQKFFRADNISTISTDGTGLGLYIVKGIIEAHGGKVWFDSKQNEGTTFYFTLPLKS